MKIDLMKLSSVTKILLIILVIAVSYLLIFLIIRPFFAPKDMMGMMEQISGGLNTTNLFSLILALIIGVVISFYLIFSKKLCQKMKREF